MNEDPEEEYTEFGEVYKPDQEIAQEEVTGLTSDNEGSQMRSAREPDSYNLSNIILEMQDAKKESCHNIMIQVKDPLVTLEYNEEGFKMVEYLLTDIKENCNYHQFIPNRGLKDFWVADCCG